MPNYITTEALRQHIGYRPEFVEDDVQVAAAVDAAEALIEDYCGRRFVPDDSSTSRIYVLTYATPSVPIYDVSNPDAATVETSSDRSTWTAYTGDYYFNSDGASFGAVDTAWPATTLEFIDTYSPARFIKVTALHGWAAVPEAVEFATKLIAAQLLARRHSPNGIEAYGDFGVIRASRYVDGHAEQLLRPYRRPASFAGIA